MQALHFGSIARADHAPRAVLPDAVVDLRTVAGAARAAAKWRYSDTAIQEIAHRDVGPDLKASGAANRAFDFAPDARAADFDDSAWEVIPADSLEKRRGHGRLSFNWYRLNITIPEKIAELDTRGATVVFEVVVDDYAEVWVDGKLPYVLGQNGAAVAAGWNAANRVVLTRDAQPGQKIQIAVFGINGPVSTHPDTYIWVRGATLDFYRPGRLGKAREARLEVERKDPALDTILPARPRLEKLADGFAFTEGPVWIDGGNGVLGPDAAEGALLFSDPNNNTIYRCTPDGEVSVYMTKSGYTGEDIAEYHQPGSNGLTIDAQGRLTICQHGNRRVVRVEKNGLTTVLADRFEGRRLNSPNDLVYRRDGALFFTDPPFGLPKFGEDSRRELPHNGVYSVKEGKIQLVSKGFDGPNGLAFSPDEKFLYVGNWDTKKALVNRYPVNADATLGKAELFYDLTTAGAEDAIDGIKVDQRGNVYVSGPGGLWIFSAAGKHLGTLHGPEHPHNMAWGDADRQALYLTAQTGIYRIRLGNPGAVAFAGK
ncbi:MAG TPA: SMP-30/gluconolactonase/LRE family protein [Verrucomicrobiae bacterium]|nr:SMP-30/gluconolactonase/LRE family protein [Verrucomicrobiae bacterium]